MASGRGLKSLNRETFHQSTVFSMCSDQLVFRFWPTGKFHARPTGCRLSFVPDRIPSWKRCESARTVAAR